ncbi:hypothetical protein E2C01_030356 [Portunus trituberculatus]|uniref:Uncharacterized protein n=1 Tax=Portunus trituberculatus TaxID=210409 RepID=A0A5B7EUJ4_PORTR|nr:hypothetical protein [Portunus trituberculatus]
MHPSTEEVKESQEALGPRQECKAVFYNLSTFYLPHPPPATPATTSHLIFSQINTSSSISTSTSTCTC